MTKRCFGKHIKYGVVVDNRTVAAEIVCWENNISVKWGSLEEVEETISPDDAPRQIPPHYHKGGEVFLEVCFDANRDARCQIKLLDRHDAAVGIIQLSKVRDQFTMCSY